MTFLDDALRTAEVRIVPGRIGRWLGRQERCVRATAAQDVRGGRCWLDDRTGRRVTERRVVDAIDRAHAAVVGARRRAASRRRT